MNIDNKYMKMAIDLALKAEGMTSPNPIVGAIIVKNGKIVGTGYHKRCGMAHAEINAIKSAGQATRGATIYVTLEPCDHFGRTPPCTDAIIKSGIKRVVIGMRDPNKINNGRGIRKLKKNGIKIKTGVLEKDAKAINKVYIKFITKNMPYVTLKIAESIDGRIATSTGDSKWITSEASRKYVHELRSKVDAVMVGMNTAIKDNPSLLSKVPGARQPMRIIVGTQSKLPKNAKVFKNTKISPVIIVSPKSSRLVNMSNLLKTLAKMNISHVMVEGGGELAASMVEGSLVDKFLFFIAPKIIGGRLAVPSIGGCGVGRIKDATLLRNINIKRFGDDTLIEAEA